MLTVSHRRGLTLVVLGVLCLVPDATSVRLADVDGVTVVFWRGLFLAAAIVLYVRATTGPFWGAARGTGRLGAISALCIGVTNFLFVQAIEHTATANVLVIISTAPLFAAGFSRLLLSERVHPRTVAAMTVALGGVALAFSSSLDGTGLGGDLMAFATAAIVGLNLTVVRKAGGGPMIPAVALGGVLSALLALPAAWPVEISLHDAAVIGTMGGILLPAALILITIGTGYLPAPEVGLVLILETVLGPLMTWAVVGEEPPELAVLGGTVVVVTLLAHSLAALAEERRTLTPAVIASSRPST